MTSIDLTTLIIGISPSNIGKEPSSMWNQQGRSKSCPWQSLEDLLLFHHSEPPKINQHYLMMYHKVNYNSE